MKANELSAINFEQGLEHCYEDLQSVLEEELDKLRAALIALPDSSSEDEKLALFESCVNSLNAVDEDENLEHGIDTDEREVLCDLLYQMGDHIGLNSETNYVDEWRDW